MLYEETQPSRVIRFVIGLAAAGEFLGMIVVWNVLPDERGRMVAAAALGLGAITMLFVVFTMHSLTIAISPQTLQFGFGPFQVKIPMREITKVRIINFGFRNAGGIGIRITGLRRWNYVAALGPGVEVEWGQKIRGFTTSNPDRIKQVLSTLLSGKVEEARET